MFNPGMKLSAAALVLALPLNAWSQAGYPNRTVRILVGFPPGQATDVSHAR
jgi:tripartite-type tricarboxylate transporter receptor subunit TctC